MFNCSELCCCYIYTYYPSNFPFILSFFSMFCTRTCKICCSCVSSSSRQALISCLWDVIGRRISSSYAAFLCVENSLYNIVLRSPASLPAETHQRAARCSVSCAGRVLRGYFKFTFSDPFSLPGLKMQQREEAQTWSRGLSRVSLSSDLIICVIIGGHINNIYRFSHQAM